MHARASTLTHTHTHTHTHIYIYIYIYIYIVMTSEILLDLKQKIYCQSFKILNSETEFRIYFSAVQQCNHSEISLAHCFMRQFYWWELISLHVKVTVVIFATSQRRFFLSRSICTNNHNKSSAYWRHLTKLILVALIRLSFICSLKNFRNW